MIQLGLCRAWWKNRNRWRRNNTRWVLYDVDLSECHWFICCVLKVHCICSQCHPVDHMNMLCWLVLLIVRSSSVYSSHSWILHQPKWAYIVRIYHGTMSATFIIISAFMYVYCNLNSRTAPVEHAITCGISNRGDGPLDLYEVELTGQGFNSHLASLHACSNHYGVYSKYIRTCWLLLYSLEIYQILCMYCTVNLHHCIHCICDTYMCKTAISVILYYKMIDRC